MSMINKGYAGANEGLRHETGEKESKGAPSSDKSGEKSGRKVNGVALGKADDSGSQEGSVGRSGFGKKESGEFNGGRSESVCYTHKRLKHSSGSN